MKIADFLPLLFPSQDKQTLGSEDTICCGQKLLPVLQKSPFYLQQRQKKGLPHLDAESVFFAPKLYVDTASGQKNA